jgi:hypothetical protein
MLIQCILSLALLAILLAADDLFRRFNWFALLFFFIVPLAMIPVWLGSGIAIWFKWTKMYSVILAGAFICLMRFTRLGERRWARIVIALVLAGNILEACVQDASQGAVWNWLNAVAGLISILAIRGWKDIRISASKERDVVWEGLDVPWIIAYTVWNWTFVYFNFPELGLIHVAVLAVPFLANLRRPGTWGQTRAYSLAAWMMLQFTFAGFVSRTSYAIPRPEWIAYACGIASLLANAIALAVSMRRRKSLRGPSGLASFSS